MTKIGIDLLLGVDGVTFHSPAKNALFQRLQDEHGINLPSNHAKLIAESNGIELFSGYTRLMGLYSSESIDSSEWNREDCWKFAWARRCDNFWCFAETAWGDQYAYAYDDMKHNVEYAVFVLDAISMTPKKVASSFADFFHSELLRQAVNPYDTTIIAAREKFGPIRSNQHLVHIPSVLLSGSEEMSEICVQNARSSMIMNGDIACQIDALEQDDKILSTETYEDSQGRTRVRLNLQRT